MERDVIRYITYAFQGLRAVVLVYFVIVTTRFTKKMGRIDVFTVVTFAFLCFQLLSAIAFNILWQSRTTPWGQRNEDLVLYGGEFARVSLMVSQNIALVFNLGRWYVVLQTLKQSERAD